MLQSLDKSDKIKDFEPIDNETATKFIMMNLNYKNHIFEEDNFWNDISSQKIKVLKLFLMEWFINKSKKDRKLWNYYILGLSEGRISNLLNDNFNSTKESILKLKKDFLRNLFTIIKIDNNSID